MSTSSSLLLRVRQRDAAAWGRFVDLYCPLVYSWCRGRGISPHDAADVVQETLRAVIGAIDRYRHNGEGSFRGWLRTIASSKIADHFRRRKPDAAAGGSEAQRNLLEAAAEETSDFAAFPDERVALLHRAVELVRAEFEPHTWEAFQLTAIEGLSATDAGEKLGMKANAVRQAKFKVLHRLREELGGLEG